MNESIKFPPAAKGILAPELHRGRRRGGPDRLGLQSAPRPPATPQTFKLKYAPSPGTFRKHAGNDYIDNIKFMADEGFSAMFDNGLMGKPWRCRRRSPRKWPVST